MAKNKLGYSKVLDVIISVVSTKVKFQFQRMGTDENCFRCNLRFRQEGVFLFQLSVPSLISRSYDKFFESLLSVFELTCKPLEQSVTLTCNIWKTDSFRWNFVQRGSAFFCLFMATDVSRWRPCVIGLRLLVFSLSTGRSYAAGYHYFVEWRNPCTLLNLGLCVKRIRFLSIQ